ncbi:MAG: hypothetical protein ABSG53_15595 [Thermoguttaceae bacterium]|jgi:hypothetical protein
MSSNKPTNPNPNDPKATPKEPTSSKLEKSKSFTLKDFDETPDESWSETELNTYAKHHHNQFRHHDKKAAIHVRRLGAALVQLRPNFDYGQWEPALKKLGISVTTAWRAMKLFESATEEQVAKLKIVAAYEKYGLFDSKKMPSSEAVETDQSPASAMKPATRTIPKVSDTEPVIENDTATDILAEMSILNDWTMEQQSEFVEKFLATSAPGDKYGDSTREMLTAIDSSGSVPAFRAFLESQLTPSNSTAKPKLFIPTASEEVVLTTEDIEAVTIFTRSVGGWSRAEEVFFLAKKQWEENRANQ